MMAATMMLMIVTILAALFTQLRGRRILGSSLARSCIDRL
jgi:hypothetical protein